MTPKENVKSLKSKNKNNSKGGSMHENIEINDEYLDEFLHNDNIYLEISMQIISFDQKVGSDIQ